jgi:hypothetical protein
LLSSGYVYIILIYFFTKKRMGLKEILRMKKIVVLLSLVLIIAGCGFTQQETTSTSIPLVPVNLAATYKDHEKIILDWDDVDNSTYYTVLHSTTTAGIFAAVGTSNASTYTTTPSAGGNNYYKVKSHFSTGYFEYSEFTLGYRSVEVTANDTALESILRTSISKVTGNIYDGELWDVTELSNYRGVNDEEEQISSIGVLVNCKNVTKITFAYHDISDLTSLSSLASLAELNLKYNNITTINALQTITTLTKLDLRSNSVIDITPLQALSLTNLDIRWNSMNLASGSDNKATLDALVASGCVVLYEDGNTL